MQVPSNCAVTTRIRKLKRVESAIYPLFIVTAIMMAAALVMFGVSMIYVARADNFTDIFYTNSFRGSFEWIKKFDWVGMIVQIVISCFSLFGVSLLVIRIMTSMLYLSAKGMWEEVSELKSSGGEAEKDFIGLFGMAKSWAKGKAGTGLDAIIGAVLILLPDVKKYSDFGKHKSGDFSEDMTMSQYMLKIALPTILTVFFFAMGFNGTLFQALAVTVDAMGTVADKAVSVNYSGFIDDLVNNGTGYKFAFSATGTSEGKFKQQIAKDIYGRVVQNVKGANADQLYKMGQNVEKWVTDNITVDNLSSELGGRLNEKVRAGFGGSGSDNNDIYWEYIGYDIVVNGNSEATSGNGEIVFDVATDGLGGLTDSLGEVSEDYQRQQYAHVFVKQTSNFAGNYYNFEAS